MTREEAIKYVNEQYGFDLRDESIAEFVVLIPLRSEAILLPEEGSDGSDRDSSEWALYDSAEKIDTGMYGGIYYF